MNLITQTTIYVCQKQSHFIKYFISNLTTQRILQILQTYVQTNHQLISQYVQWLTTLIDLHL